EEPNLTDSTGENELKIPAALGNESDNESEVAYTVRAQKGETEIFDGAKTKTYGYNGDFLGPVLRFSKGDKVKINTINELDEETTFHWHGLEVPGEADGGPHETLEPGEEKQIEFEVTQEASTLWFHPHPDGKTAEQVYNGLAGWVYIEDGNAKSSTINERDEETTFHWHGVEVPGEADGGPHETLEPGEEKQIEFEVTQEASTLWFHPHPDGKTAEQVYNGLAGLVYIEDDNSKS